MAGDPGFTLQALWALREDRTLAEAQWKVLVALIMFADSDGQCHPSTSRIAQVARTSRCAVRRALKALENGAGPIAVTVTRGRTTEAGDPDTHCYQLQLSSGGSDHTDPTPDHRDPTPGPQRPHRWDHTDPTGGTTEVHEEDIGRRHRKKTLKKGAGARQQPLPAIAVRTDQEQATLDALTTDQTFAGRVKDPEQTARDLCAERPELDVAATVLAAGRWLRANPRKSPKTGYRRFLLGWVKREGKDGGGRKRNAVTPQGAHADNSEIQRLAEQSAKVRAAKGLEP